MLKGPSSVDGRPVARPWGRRTLAWVVVGVALAAAACGRPPQRPEVDGWRGALSRAMVELRTADPQRAGDLERLVSWAEAAEAAVRDERSSRRAVTAWNAAMVQAALDLREVRRMTADRRAQLSARLSSAARAVELAEVRASQAGSTREHARAAQAARIRLRAAINLADGGDLDGAFTAVDDAVTLADDAQEGWRRQRDRMLDPALREVWSGQVADTVALSRRDGVAVVVVDKAARRVHVYRHGRGIEVFEAELGTAGLAPKRHAGDNATPEGRYRVTTVKTGGATRYYKALLLDYPNAADRRRYELERSAGAIAPGVGIGGLIEIHGHGGRGRDWTEGCVALRDEDMDRLLELVGVGTPVTIVGRME